MFMFDYLRLGLTLCGLSRFGIGRRGGAATLPLPLGALTTATATMKSRYIGNLNY